MFSGGLFLVELLQNSKISYHLWAWSGNWRRARCGRFQLTEKTQNFRVMSHEQLLNSCTMSSILILFVLLGLVDHCEANEGESDEMFLEYLIAK